MTALALPTSVEDFKAPPEDIHDVLTERLGEAPEYQRPLHLPSVQKIAENWDRRLAEILLISERKDGALIIIDGLTRRAAAKEARPRVRYLLCQIIKGLSKQEEARLFVLKNSGRRAVHILDRYRAAVCAEDTVAVEIEHALEMHGFHTGFKGDGSISAVQALEYAHAWNALLPTLGIIKAAWGYKQVALSKPMILAIAAFDYVHRHEGEALYEESYLLDLLREHSPAAMMAEATPPPSGRFSNKKKTPAWVTLADMITTGYNGTVPRDLKLDRFEQPDLPRAALVISKGNGGMNHR